MTQTTAVRVESILESHLHLIPLMVGVDGESADIGGMTEAAQKIAAEIDALTRERDEARAEIATLTLKLANARLNLKHCSEEVDKRDECAGQLAEARAEVESCRKAYAQMRSTEDEWKRDTLAALKAEVERLRPAAEAWEALQAAYHPGRGSSLEYAYSVACVERAGVLRARKAAKEGKP